MSGEVLHLLLYEGSGILFVTTLAVTAVARPPLGKWSEIAQLLPYLCVCDRRATERERERERARERSPMPGEVTERDRARGTPLAWPGKTERERERDRERE